MGPQQVIDALAVKFSELGADFSTAKNCLNRDVRIYLSRCMDKYNRLLPASYPMYKLSIADAWVDGDCYHAVVDIGNNKKSIRAARVVLDMNAQ